MVYHRDHGRSSFLAADQWPDVCLPLQTLFIEGMSGKCKANRKIQYALDDRVSSLENLAARPRDVCVFDSIIALLNDA